MLTWHRLFKIENATSYIIAPHQHKWQGMSLISEFYKIGGLKLLI